MNGIGVWENKTSKVITSFFRRSLNVHLILSRVNLPPKCLQLTLRMHDTSYKTILLFSWANRSTRINFLGNPFWRARDNLLVFKKKNVFSTFHEFRQTKGCFERSLILCASSAHPSRLYKTFYASAKIDFSWKIVSFCCCLLSHFITAINKFL